MYLAVIIDLFSRKVVGWSLRERMTAELVCEALDAAVQQRRPPPGLIFHSDRGCQYASRALQPLPLLCRVSLPHAPLSDNRLTSHRWVWRSGYVA
jgi:transposase InsO family protein